MKAHRRRPGVERALAYLEIECERVRIEGRRVLPPVVRLAAGAGVSPHTMWKAVRALCDGGGLSTRAGSGIFLTDGTPSTGLGPRLPARSDTCVWRRIREGILRRISTGEFAPGSRLPSCKELCTGEGAGYRAVRSALRALETERWILRCGRGYAVRDLRVQGRHRVLLIMAGHRNGRPYFFSPRTEANLGALENECARRGLMLDICVCELAGGQYMQGAPVDVWTAAARHDYLGTIVWSIAITPEALTRVLDAVCASDKPAAVLDEGSDFRYGPWLRPTGRLRLFSTADHAAGRRMAQYLLAAGHRRVAFFSLSHDQPWSRGRLAGMRAVFSGGHAPDVRLREYVCECGDYLQQWMKDRPFYRGMLRRVEVAAARAGVEPQTYALLMDVLGRVRYAADMEAVPPQLRAFCAAALRDETTTAWVGANDLVALKCLRCLREAGRKTPVNLSVAGFDDSMESLYEQLTSYSFNSHALISAMLAFLNDPRPARRQAQNVVTVEGMVVERASCGPRPAP